MLSAKSKCNYCICFLQHKNYLNKTKVLLYLCLGDAEMDVKQIIAQMTLEEKASMVSGADFWRLDAIERLGVPQTMVSDGPHGLRKQSDKADHLGVNESITAVCYPTAVGTAASFNRQMLNNLGKTLGKECQAENVSILLGPAVNIKRSPLCGRNFEYFSEDPYLTGQLATSYIYGVQSQHIGTSIKHFALNNQEKRRATVSAVLDERTMREIYLLAFEESIKSAKPWTVMCSYNKILGKYSSENDFLLNKILREEWGYEGYVMSDWGAVHNRVEGVAAGLDLEMPSSGAYNTNKLIDAVNKNKLDEQILNKACERILTAVSRYVTNRKKDAKFSLDEHHEIARKIAGESMVLLKNNGVLPLEKESEIAFIGEFASKPRYQGGGSSHINTYKAVSALQAVDGSKNIKYAQGFVIDKDDYNEAMAAQAIETAKNASIAVVFAGLPDYIESEGYDRQNLDLPNNQNKLIEEILKVQPNVVVVLHNGSPVAMPWLKNVSAVLEAYLAGEACGEAVVDILFGEVNPSAKLAETFPLTLEDTPCNVYFPGEQTVEHREGIYVGYRYYDKAAKNVLFPFGYGLSYTTFEYSDFSINKTNATANDEITVSFKIKNTGNCDGAEIAQVYVTIPEISAFQVQKSLQGFEKVFLKKGEEKEVSIVLSSRAFQFYNINLKRWQNENGEYLVHVGKSSREIIWCTAINFTAPTETIIYPIEKFPSYYLGRVNNVPDLEFERLLGGPIPPHNHDKNKVLTLQSTLEDAQNTAWGKRLLKILLKQTKVEDGMDNPEMMQAMFMETPLEVSISMGILTEEKAKAVVNLFNNKHVLKSLITLVKK